MEERSAPVGARVRVRGRGRLRVGGALCAGRG